MVKVILWPFGLMKEIILFLWPFKGCNHQWLTTIDREHCNSVIKLHNH